MEDFVINAAYLKPTIRSSIDDPRSRGQSRSNAIEDFSETYSISKVMKDRPRSSIRKKT